MEKPGQSPQVRSNSPPSVRNAAPESVAESVAESIAEPAAEPACEPGMSETTRPVQALPLVELPGEVSAGEGSTGAELPGARDRGAGQREAVSLFPIFGSRHLQMLKTGIAGLLVLLAIEWILIALDRPDPLFLERGDTYRQQFRVEINSATWVEWLQLDGIGPSLAHRIVADRRLNGPFRSIDEVSRVPGIGPATLDRIRPWLTIRYDISPAQPHNVPSEPQSVTANSDE